MTTSNDKPNPPGIGADAVRPIVPEAPQANIEANLPAVLRALAEFGLADKPMLRVALATIRVETEVFKPIDEFPSVWNTPAGGPAFALYNGRADLGNGPQDGALFKGRGYVQLTGRANYQLHSRALGLADRLVSEPELANDPVIAARILASFLKAHETRIREALGQGDLKEVRRLVNGGLYGLEAFEESFAAAEMLPETVDATSSSTPPATGGRPSPRTSS